jgi:hypothetical protein
VGVVGARSLSSMFWNWGVRELAREDAERYVERVEGNLAAVRIRVGLGSSTSPSRTRFSISNLNF